MPLFIKVKDILKPVDIEAMRSKCVLEIESKSTPTRNELDKELQRIIESLPTLTEEEWQGDPMPTQVLIKAISSLCPIVISRPEGGENI